MPCVSLRSAVEQSVFSSTELFPNDSARAIIPSYLAARAAAFQGTLAEQHALCPHFPMSDMVLPHAAPDPRAVSPCSPAGVRSLFSEPVRNHEQIPCPDRKSTRLNSSH